jgi:hypothetical protein
MLDGVGQQFGLAIGLLNVSVHSLILESLSARP